MNNNTSAAPRHASSTGTCWTFVTAPEAEVVTAADEPCCSFRASSGSRGNGDRRSDRFGLSTSGDSVVCGASMSRWFILFPVYCKGVEEQQRARGVRDLPHRAGHTVNAAFPVPLSTPVSKMDPCAIVKD